ncbi:MAG: hypothetical protein ACRCX2_38020 [Paraclostridium sp.]
MIKFKQLICDHNFIIFPSEEVYLSVGDEYHNRKSKKYICECSKCKKQIKFTKRWTLLEEEDIDIEYVAKKKSDKIKKDC